MKKAIVECEFCGERYEWDLPVEMSDSCCKKCWDGGHGDWHFVAIVDFKESELGENSEQT